MSNLKTEKTQQEKKNFEMFGTLSKGEMSVIRGGEQGNTEIKDEDT